MMRRSHRLHPKGGRRLVAELGPWSGPSNSYSRTYTVCLISVWWSANGYMRVERESCCFCIFVFVWVRVHVCMCACVCMCVCVCMSASVCGCVCVCVCVCGCVCVCWRVYTCDAADEEESVGMGVWRDNKKKKNSTCINTRK